MGQVIAFWVFAVAIIGTALGVVLLKNVFRSAVLLVTCFLAVAGVFILLSADFLAAMQILIYVGAVAVFDPQMAEKPAHARIVVTASPPRLCPNHAWAAWKSRSL